MTETELQRLTDPDLFASEVHMALLSEGLRGSYLRRLMRVARPIPELERIFETKVSEFRRYLRDVRTRTLWNLPIRAWEWVSDHAKVTPLRDVFMTFVYVVIALAAIEFVKTTILPGVLGPAAGLAWSGGLGSNSNSLARFSENPAARSEEQLEESMIARLTASSHSDAWRSALKRQISESPSAGEALRVRQASIQAMLDSPVFREQLNRQVSEAVAKAATRNRAETPPEVDAWLRSDDFQQRLASLVRDALAARAQAPSVGNAATVATTSTESSAP